jgi:hypothetical protein
MRIVNLRDVLLIKLSANVAIIALLSENLDADLGRWG